MQSRCGGIVILFLGMDSVRRARHNMIGNHTYNSVIYFELVWHNNSGPRHQTDARIAHTVITPVQESGIKAAQKTVLITHNGFSGCSLCSPRPQNSFLLRRGNMETIK